MRKKEIKTEGTGYPRGLGFARLSFIQAISRVSSSSSSSSMLPNLSSDSAHMASSFVNLQMFSALEASSSI